MAHKTIINCINTTTNKYIYISNYLMVEVSVMHWVYRKFKRKLGRIGGLEIDKLYSIDIIIEALNNTDRLARHSCLVQANK